MSKKEALETVKELVTDFNRNRDNFLAKDYLENHLENHFVIPFLKALGWDVESKGIAPFLREVVTQDRVKVGNAKKAPDYGFGLPGSERRLFYLEAKAPSIKIKTDKDAAFQLRRYGRSGQTAVSILFNFNEFAIYDCTQKQSAASDAKFARLKYFTCDEYADNFDFIYDTFSREAVYNGNFHRYIQDKTQKKGSVTLDKDFVESLNKWRLNLAKSIAKNNFKLGEEEINIAVQLLLDRIIFLRFCEERDVEPYGQLQAVANHAHIYKHLFDLFYVADQKYNAGIFDFKKDELTEKLRIEDKVIKSIIEDLYPPKSDYAFSIIPVEILGNAYEQFLGKVIKVTAGHTVKIEEKPEVRKAGGVYYTPQYIVDYIVENTVGKLTEGKSPKEIEKLKIVDPACGSGSFLLGAYKYLLSYHQKWYYHKNPKSKELTENGTLTTDEKRKILSNNIYGVDLDTNAVEVSKLSLLLKCMEGETASTVKQQISLHHTRVLPNIDKNIVNGNSLINHDFFEGKFEFNKEEKKELEHKIKPFDWKTTFPVIFKQGGFDAVIGNPPYVTIGGKEDTLFLKPEVDYFLLKYLSNDYKPNLYAFFYEKSLKVLKENGLVSFIVPRTFIDNIYYKKLREHFTKNSKLNFLTKINYEVFEDATTGGTFISVFENVKKSNPKVNCFDINNIEEFLNKKPIIINQNEILIGENKSFSFTNPESQRVLNTIYSRGKKLDFFCSVNNGVNTGNVAKVLLSEKSQGKTYKKILEGKDINRYVTNWKGLWINYDSTIRNRIKLKDLETKQNKIDFALRDYRIFSSPKIIIRQTADKIIATFDNEQFISRHSTHCILNDFEPINFF